MLSNRYTVNLLDLKRGSRYLGIIISLATIVVFALIYGPLNLLSIFLSLPRFFIFFFLIALAFHLLSFAFWSLRIELLSRVNGHRVTFRQSFTAVIASLFAASITPGYVGGEPVRIKKLNDYGIPVGGATAIALGERGFDSIFFVLVFVISILSGLLELSAQLKFLATIGVVILLLFLAFLLLSMGAHTFFHRIEGWLGRAIKRFQRKEKQGSDPIPRILENVVEYSRSTRQIFLKNPWVLLAGILVTALLWFSDFTVPSVLLIGFGVTPNWVYIIFVQAVLVLLSLIPLIPGLAGIMEVLMLATFSIFLQHGNLLAFVIIWRFITFYFNIILGSVVIHKVLTK